MVENSKEEMKKGDVIDMSRMNDPNVIKSLKNPGECSTLRYGHLRISKF